MFGNFFGIVIISASALMISALILRPTPDLPAKMNLGIVDKTVNATLQTPSSVVSDSIEPTTADQNTDTFVDTAKQIKTKNPTVPETTSVEIPMTPTATVLNKKYLEIKKRAVQKSVKAPARANKSDSGKYADQ